MKERQYNGGKWTKSRYYNFIKNALRSASIKWPPRLQIKNEAKRDKGRYKCAGYKRRAHLVPTKIERANNIFVDHIDPILSGKGFSSWDTLINDMFCEKDNLQLLCKECHNRKTKEENQKN